MDTVVRIRPFAWLSSSLLVMVAAAVGSEAGCGGDPESVFDPDGQRDASLGDSGEGTSPGFSDGGDRAEGGGLGECTSGCVTGARCKYGQCIPDLGACRANGDCPGDSYCDTDDTCVPYGLPPGKVNDPTCARAIDPGVVQPAVQCEWAGPAAGDPTAAFVNVYSTPVVADLNLDKDPNRLQPSVIMTTWSGDERMGMLRVFDGRTCAEQMRIGGPDDPDVANNRPGYGTQWAIGDLDGDVPRGGHPEIVGLRRTTGSNYPPLQAIAYAVDSTVDPPRLVRKWLGRICGQGGAPDTPYLFPTATNHANYGPGIWDLDDDGKPEVIVDAHVFDADGCLLNASPAPPDVSYLQLGVMSTVADVDRDGKPDLVRGDGIYGWNTASRRWELKPYFTRTAQHLQGHVAVADLGRYSTLPGTTAADPLPEIIVVSAQFDGTTYPHKPNSTGSIRVQTITGEIVFGPYPLFRHSQQYGGHGGAPTAADFDGDGQVEFAAAANEFYTVYDPDCVAGAPDGGSPARPGGKCMRPAHMAAYASGAAFDAGAAPLSGILWAQPSKDYSSSATGSSIFDFNGDGTGEVVYRDECYLRVYEGPTGKVIFSAPASSGTGYEEPVIVDVDGDFATEIVVARASNSPDVGNGERQCPLTDPLFDAGAGVDAGTYSKRGGFVVLRDPLDRWAASRPIWNQHAYSITHVNDDGTVPRSSAMRRNWEQPGLNNFRQNTQGQLGQLALADLTVTMQNLVGLCSGQSGNLPFETRVCNRGTNPVQDGVAIEFYATPSRDGGAGEFDAAAATKVCGTKTTTLLRVGECTNVSCTGFLPVGQDIYVVADPENQVADCHPGNNNGGSARLQCVVVK